MSDITVSVVNQTVTVSPSTQALTVTVPYSNTATVSSIDDLSDVALVGVGNGYILRHNGTAWSGVPGSTYFAAASHTHPQSDVTGLVAFVSNTNTTLLDQSDMIGQAQFDISNLQAFDATLGTAATLSFNVAGDATSTQAVRGNDSRLTNARTPTSHVHSYADITSGYPALTSASSQRTTTITLSTSAWTSLGSVSLAAGTWLVQSTVTAQHSSATGIIAIRIANGATVYASTEGRTPASNVNLSLSCSAIVTLASSATITHEGATSATTSTVQFQTSLISGTQAAGATYMTAVRIA
jgi:hypothetical protein